MDYTQELKETIEVTRREYIRLAEWFRSFSEADWAAPTFCPEWTASQVAGHITFGGEFFASSVRNGLKGELGFPFGAKNRDEFLLMREGKAKEIGALDGPSLADRFEASTRDVVDLFASLDPKDYETPAWHRRCVFPIRRFILSRLNEYLLHEWDIRNDTSARLAGPSIAIDSVAIAARNLRQHCQLFYELSPAKGLSGTFAFELTDTGYLWATRVDNDKGIDLRIGEHSPDAIFSATAGDMLLLITGRLPVEGCRADGRLRVDGDEEKVQAFLPTLFFPL